MSKILFKVNDSGKIIDVEYSGEITCQEFILDFTKKYTNYPTTDPGIYTFLIRAKVLNSPNFMNKKLKDLICNNGVIKLIKKMSICYAGPLEFSVSDNGELINVNYSPDITCEEFMLDFTKKNTNLSTTDPKIYTFSLGGKLLNNPRFVHKKLGDLISNQTVVHFYRKKDIYY